MHAITNYVLNRSWRCLNYIDKWVILFVRRSSFWSLTKDTRTFSRDKFWSIKIFIRNYWTSHGTFCCTRSSSSFFKFRWSIALLLSVKFFVRLLRSRNFRHLYNIVISLRSIVKANYWIVVFNIFVSVFWIYACSLHHFLLYLLDIVIICSSYILLVRLLLLFRKRMIIYFNRLDHWWWC